jgi:putative transposase
MANKTNDLAHTKWMCKYHIVFTPKYRRKIIYNQYKESIKDILKQLCAYKGVEIIEGHLMPDHIHMLVSILVLCQDLVQVKMRNLSQLNSLKAVRLLWLFRTVFQSRLET